MNDRQPSPVNDSLDVIIVGAGPAGSTAAALLAKAGKRVLILERDHFPRFHVGESLLPMGNSILKRLGIYDKLAGEGFIPKHGAEFLPSTSLPLVRVYFARVLKEKTDPAYNVERSRFDHMLLLNAESCGATAMTGTTAKNLRIENDKVLVSVNNGSVTREIRGTWLLDASGLGHFAGKTLSLEKMPLNISPKVATFGHFRDVYRNEGLESGHVSIIRFANGWFWFIPISESTTSVGMVQHSDVAKRSGLSLEEIFHKACKELPEVRFRMKDAIPVDKLHKASDYTTRYKSLVGPRHLIIGDAGSFIDPIFSSGVLLALKGGELAADTLLRRKAFTQALSRNEQQGVQRKLYYDSNQLLPMIRNFYDQSGYELFMAPQNSRTMFDAISRLLAGKFDLSLADRLRINGFYLLSRLQRHLKLVPRIPFTSSNH